MMSAFYVLNADALLIVGASTPNIQKEKKTKVLW